MARVEGWQVANLLCFVLNVVAVRNIARLDSDNEMLQSINYFTPAPYAFVIWAVIYSLECLFIFWQLLQSSRRAPPSRVAVLKRVSPYWCAANACQVLWCLTFRPSFDTPQLLWISAVALTAIAVSLSAAHNNIVDEDAEERLFLYAPISLHFGWTSAAALVNWNGYVARSCDSASLKLAALFISLGLAAVLGVGITRERQCPLYGMTVAWAITAVAVQTSKSVQLADEVPGANDTLTAISLLEFALGLLIFACAVLEARPWSYVKEDRPRLQHAALSWAPADGLDAPMTRRRTGRSMSFWRRDSNIGL